MSAQSEKEIISSGTQAAIRGGCHQLEFSGEHVVTAKIPSLPLNVTFTLPSGARISSKAFARNDGKAVARCYLPESGEWKWEAKSSAGKGVASGRIQVEDSDLPGKLRISQQDSRQFVYDNRTPFLHIGDIAEALLSPSQDNWQSYIDQAAQAGFTKIRVRLPDTEQSAANFFDQHRKQLNLAFWDEVESRLLYALGRYPKLQFQLNLFAQDREELDRFEEGDTLTHLAVTYITERLSSLANVHWSLASEIDPGKDSAVTLQALSRLGKTIYEQSPWHSLITCGLPRYAAFLFDREKWCSYASLSSLGQVDGSFFAENSGLTSKPLVLDQDRAEYHLAPSQPRYYFRRLFWSVLLSGGHPTYQGLDTSGQGRGHKSGIIGYYDACHADRLNYGASDLLNIHTFLRESCESLTGWIPDDSIAGNKPLLAKAIRSAESDQCVIYVANPDSHAGHSGKKGEGFYSDQNAGASDIFTTFNLELPFATGSATWFCPTTGEWKGKVEITKASTIFLTPEPGDWVLWIIRA